MNENLDLREILKNVPAGTKLYSPIFGVVEFQGVLDGAIYPVKVIASDDCIRNFEPDGRYYTEYNESECLLFPSKEQRDWSKFEAPKPERKKIQVHLNPFDKVLARDNEESKWCAGFYEKYEHGVEYPHICIDSGCKQVIPYNEDTKHLIGTANSPSIDYEVVAWNQ